MVPEVGVEPTRGVSSLGNLVAATLFPAVVRAQPPTYLTQWGAPGTSRLLKKG